MRWTGLLFWLVFSSGAIVIISKSAKEIGIERFGAQSLIRYFAAGNISVGFGPGSGRFLPPRHGSVKLRA
jgi:hypothetical protein